jgi:HTH-type transcriptional regulator/antitoxin HigA
LAHILTMDEGGYLDHMDEPAVDEAEKMADRLTREWLIDQAAYDEFVSGAGLYFSEKRIRTYAENERRHPGIVLGRLQHDGLVPYKNLRKLLVDVKSYLAPWIDASGPAL